MHRHYVTSKELLKERLSLERTDARHFINVLRLRTGDVVELFDGNGGTASFRILSVASGSAELERVGDIRRMPPFRCRIVLGACISKGKRMDWTIEKAVELGVSEIVPILSDHSVVRIDAGFDAEEKRLRWERIAIDAARQCGAAFIPRISPPLSFSAALRHFLNNDKIYVGALTPDAIPLRDVLAKDRSNVAPDSIAWLIGPEGDFSQNEYNALRQNGATMVSLGQLVLRTETAAIYGLCVFGSEWL